MYACPSLSNLCHSQFQKTKCGQFHGSSGILYLDLRAPFGPHQMLLFLIFLSAIQSMPKFSFCS